MLPYKNDLFPSSPEKKTISTTSKCLNNFPNSQCLFHMRIIIFILIILTLIGVIVDFSLNNQIQESRDKTNPGKTTDKPNHDNGLVTMKPVGPGLIIEKTTWGGRQANNNLNPLSQPISLVIISHTVTPKCQTFFTCSKSLQNIQDYHIGVLNIPDIGYNFVIGGDGNAYVGRGWVIENFHQCDSIGISFIGNYTRDYLTADMIDVVKKLLNDGFRKRKLSKNYKLVAHNQTYETLSPGVHVYEEIKTWSHYYSSNYTNCIQKAV